MTELKYIEVSKIYPHPDNPRKELGDLAELADSIKANGVLQNLTVVPLEGDTFRVIIGHRRLAAATIAGRTTVPCVVTEMTQKEQLATMLLENMQRSDLTVYEQAQGFQMMLDLGETVESIAKKSGFSQTTVRRRVKLLDLDAEKFRKSEARGATLQDYMELDKIEDHELKNKALDAIGTANFRNELKSAIEADKIKKRMAIWKADLEAFADEIEKRDYIGDEYTPMDYVRNYGRWSGDVSVERPGDLGTVRYYFRVSDNQIDLYKDHQETEETEEDRARKAARAELDRRTAEIEEISKRHHSLRADFICDFGKAKKCIAQIARFAAGLFVGDGSWVRYEPNAELLSESLEIDIDDNTDYATLMAMVDQAASRSPEYTLLACAFAFANVDDDNNKYFCKRWNSEKMVYEIRHAANDELDHLYDFLISLGYEMSDEEKAMQDGTHDLFRVDEKPEEDPCALCRSAHPTCDKCCEACTDKCNAWQSCRKAARE